MGLLLVLLLTPLPVLADFDSLGTGARLFDQHCAGCHLNGGNIIRRSKTLKLAALQRRGLASEETISAIVADGTGQMSGYGAVLGTDGVQQVAGWVLHQAELGWPRSS